MIDEGRPLSAEACAADLDVSRETAGRLATYVELLKSWQTRINLVAASTLQDPWRRHILDCGQLARHIEGHHRTVVDLGSGAGLPGLILAIITSHHVHLIESDRRKVIFLREAVRQTRCANVSLHDQRIEEIDLKGDIIVARALAPLAKLLSMALPVAHNDSVMLFLKGRRFQAELTEAQLSWTMRASVHASRSDPQGRILEIREVARGAS